MRLSATAMKMGFTFVIIPIVLGVSTFAQANTQAFCDNVAPGTRWDGKKCTDAPIHSSVTLKFTGPLAGTHPITVDYPTSRYRSSTPALRPTREIYAYCTELFPRDYVLRESCIRQQNEAKQRIGTK